MEEHGFTQEEVARSVGKSRPAVANALRLLKLPEEIAEYVRTEAISAGHARALLTLSDEKQMKEVCEQIVKNDLSVRQTEKLCKKLASGKTSASKQPEKLPNFYREVALTLSESLGRKISVTKSKGKQGGVLQIEFYSDEELTELSNKLS